MSHGRGVRPFVRSLSRAGLFTLVAAFAVLVAALPADAYEGWEHATATESACAVGCHAHQSSTNATCTGTGCHTGFKALAAQRCWECHSPGRSTSAWRAGACTGSCHASSVHLGADFRTCTSCHGVSASSSDPGTSPHHDAADDPAPTCKGCHDGVQSSAKVGHDGVSSCEACHGGIDRPPVPAACLACHASSSHPEATQIAFSNDVSCTDALCHGSEVVHTPSPAPTEVCGDCHTPHFQSIGPCAACHDDVPAYHHGTQRAVPLSDCATCHDGSPAPAKERHADFLTCSSCHVDMSSARQPEACWPCHLKKRVGSGVCTTCHSVQGIMGKDQAHSADPVGKTCLDCHDDHYGDLGECSSCHWQIRETHHGVASVGWSSITLASVPKLAVSGGAAVLSGRLADNDGGPHAFAEVAVQERRASQTAFADLTTVTTTADGSFSLQVRPLVSMRYRAVWRGVSTLSAVHEPAVRVLSVDVFQKVRMAAEGRRIAGVVQAVAGRPLQLSGSIAPSSADLGGGQPGAALVRVQQQVARAGGGMIWKTVARLRLGPDQNGDWWRSWTPPRRALYRLRAEASATTDLLAATGGWLKVRAR